MSSLKPVSDSKAIVLYRAQQSSEEFLQSQVEMTTNVVAQGSLESVKYAANYFPQISSNFTGRNFFQISSASLSPPKSFKTDSGIEIEIFAAAPSDHKPPILIFSHGWTVPSRNYRALLGELASNGYTVLNLTHQSSLDEERYYQKLCFKS